MRNSSHLSMIVVCVALALAALPAGANIYLDEDFEGATPFTDQNWPIIGTTITPTVANIAPQGINLLAYGDANATPKVTIGTNQGSVVSDRFFDGAKGYRLQSGQKLAVTPGGFPTRHTNWYRLWQFAVSTDLASVGLTSGTQIGHFKVDYSTHGTGDLVVDASYRINLVANGASGVNIICGNNGAMIGTLNGHRANWALITVVQQHAVGPDPGRANSPQPWQGLDPLTSITKGPNRVSEGPPIVYYQMDSGLNVFVNSKAVTTLVTNTALGTAWGTPTSGSGFINSPAEIGWEYAAENSGTIYLDDLYWDCSGKNNEVQQWQQAQDARMDEFNKASTEPPDAAADRAWTLY